MWGQSRIVPKSYLKTWDYKIHCVIVFPVLIWFTKKHVWFIYIYIIDSKRLHIPSNYTIQIIQIPWSFSRISTTPHYELMTASNIRVHCVCAWICVFFWSLEKIENTKSPNWWLMCGYKKRPNDFYSLEILLNGVTVNTLVLQALDPELPAGTAG